MAFNGFRRIYGSHPLHLLTLVAGFALFGYVLATIKPVTLWNPNTWWQSIAVWFAAAIVAHDLVLFPIYALADRLLLATGAERRPASRVPVLNYIRIPALGAGLIVSRFPARHHQAGRADVQRRYRPDSGRIPGQVAAAHRGDVRHQRGRLRYPAGDGRSRCTCPFRGTAAEQ